MIRENMISQKRLTGLGLFRQENTTDVKEATSLERNKGYHEQKGNKLFSVSIADQDRGQDSK